MDKNEKPQSTTYIWDARHLVGPAAMTRMLSVSTHWGAVLRGAPRHILADFEHMNFAVTVDPELVATANTHPGGVLRQGPAGPWVLVEDGDQRP